MATALGGSSSTLEVQWRERGVAMRLYMYFESDGAHWWSDDIRTYDGSDDSDGTRWIYYYGEFFRTAKGESFTGDVDLISSDSDNGVEGRIYFDNMRLVAR